MTYLLSSHKRREPSAIFPTALKIVEDNKLLIEWSDGLKYVYSFRELRDQCPCATCREKRKKDDRQPATLFPVLSVLTAAEARPLRIEGIKPIGHYAYGIAFSDGHNTGIYSLEFLRTLGTRIGFSDRLVAPASPLAPVSEDAYVTILGRPPITPSSGLRGVGNRSSEEFPGKPGTTRSNNEGLPK